MAITTLGGRELSKDTSRAKKASSKGPVFITYRAKLAHVLLSIRSSRGYPVSRLS